MRLALFLGLASLAPGSARIPCGPPGGPAVDHTCAAEYGGARCDFDPDERFCRDESPTWHLAENRMLRCDWVSRDPAARCDVVGEVPYVGCVNESEHEGHEDCDYVVRERAVAAYEACCESCAYGTCDLSTPAPTAESDGSSAQSFEFVFELVWMGFVVLVVFALFARELLKPLCRRGKVEVEAEEEEDTWAGAIDRAGLRGEIETEQRFSIQFVDLARNVAASQPAWRFCGSNSRLEVTKIRSCR